MSRLILKLTTGEYTLNKNNLVFMHYNEEKFWEISLKSLKTLIRVGKLLDINIEVPDPQQIEKTHLNIEEARKYIEKHVQQKQDRGYKIHEIQDDNNINNKQNKQLIGENKEKQEDTDDLSAKEEDQEPQLKKKIKTNDQDKFVPQIIINQPDNNVNQEKDQEEEKKSNEEEKHDNQSNLNSLQVINNREYSTSSRKSSLVSLTDENLSMASRSNDDDDDRDNDDDDDDERSIIDYNLGKPSNQGINVLLAEKWDESVNPKGYYMSEKLDGVRCFWSGKRMYSRNQQQFFPPKFFTKNWPNCQLDGELFTKRNDFQKCVGIIKKKNPIDEEWKMVTYIVFDAPGLTQGFKARYELLKDAFDKIQSPYVKLHPHIICEGRQHLDEQLDKVLKSGGEGVMLRQINSKYENRRSTCLLKVKVFTDEEATIIGHEKGTGRCENMLGALVAVNDKGVQFKIGSGFDDNFRKHPPKIGSRVTYKYQNLTNDGKPRFPIFLRLHEGV